MNGVTRTETDCIRDDNPPSTPPKKLLSMVEAAHAMNIGLTKTYELVNMGELETVRIGRRKLVPVRSIDALIERLSAA